MAATTFHLLKHKLGFWDAIQSLLAFDVLSGTDEILAISVQVKVFGLDSYRLTLHIVDPQGTVLDTYFCDESALINLPIVGWGYQIFRDKEFIHPFCILPHQGRNPSSWIDLGASNAIAPVILSVCNDSRHELHLVEPPRKLAEIRSPERGVETKVGIRFVLNLNPDLDEDSHRLTLVSAVTKAVFLTKY